MRYTPRDLRAADLFALILIGFGLVCLVVGILAFTTSEGEKSDASVIKSENGKSVAIGKGAKPSLPPGVAFAVAGFTLSCLGAALSFKVRQLIRTGGVEPSEYGEETALPKPPAPPSPSSPHTPSQP